MGVIFDLDQTLIDSSIAVDYRKPGKWPMAYSLIPDFPTYEGVIDIVNFLNANNVPICIVTSSPSKYCGLVLDHHKIEIANRVCYHDTTLRKPCPHPILKAAELINLNPSQIISIGDDAKDIIASNSAGVFSVAVTWGAVNLPELLASKPSAVCENAEQLKDLLISRLKISANI